MIEVWNKIDLLPPGERPPRIVPPRANGKSGGSPLVVSVAALTGEGLPELLQAIEDRISEGHAVYRIELTGERLGDLHKLYDFGEVLEREDRGDGSILAKFSRTRPVGYSFPYGVSQRGTCQRGYFPFGQARQRRSSIAFGTFLGPVESVVSVAVTEGFCVTYRHNAW